MDFAMVSAPAAAIRRKPRHSSEMVNQLLFGECVRVLKARNDMWIKVRSLHDDYQGWVTITVISEVKEDVANSTADFLTASLFSSVRIGDRTLNLPFGSGFGGGQTFNTHTPVIDLRNVVANAGTLRELALQWLHAPYLWGGRTPMGVDCSGLVQVLFKAMGIALPRDAWQQAQSGTAVKKFRDALPGDLLFFDERDEIVHVGILIEPGKMIHASGTVRIDEVDKKGIVNPQVRSRKLKLQAIRRLL